MPFPPSSAVVHRDHVDRRSRVLDSSEVSRYRLVIRTSPSAAHVEVHDKMIQWQLNLGPLGLVIEFLITVAVVAVVSWLLFKKNSSVFWKQTDYAYLTFAVIGGIVAAADLATSNWTNELQQNRIVRYRKI